MKKRHEVAILVGAVSAKGRMEPHTKIYWRGNPLGKRVVQTFWTPQELQPEVIVVVEGRERQEHKQMRIGEVRRAIPDKHPCYPPSSRLRFKDINSRFD